MIWEDIESVDYNITLAKVSNRVLKLSTLDVGSMKEYLESSNEYDKETFLNDAFNLNDLSEEQVADLRLET